MTQQEKSDFLEGIKDVSNSDITKLVGLCNWLTQNKAKYETLVSHDVIDQLDFTCPIATTEASTRGITAAQTQAAFNDWEAKYQSDKNITNITNAYQNSVAEYTKIRDARLARNKIITWIVAVTIILIGVWAVYKYVIKK